MGRDTIIACDFSSREETLSFLEKFGSKRPFIKIGMELYYAEGPEMVKELEERGHKIFLDLKLHDIPNTVRKAAAVLGRMGTQMTTVHAGGTKAMMTAAATGIRKACDWTERNTGSDRTDRDTVCDRPLLLAVTQLTSTSEGQMQEELLIDRPLEDVVISYAINARDAGLDGVICSPLEAKAVHEACGDAFLTVTPGVRLAGDTAGDQARVTTPAKARELGADYIVVGRSITAAEDPLYAYERCMKEFTGRSEQRQG